MNLLSNQIGLSLILLFFPMNNAQNSNFVQEKKAYSYQLSSFMITQSSSKNTSLVQWFEKLFQRVGSDSGDRGVFCSLFPNHNVSDEDLKETISTQPTFIWQTGENSHDNGLKFEPKRITIKNKNGDIVWTHMITSEERQQNSVTYLGDPLTSGSYSYIFTYTLQINENITVEEEEEPIDFEVLDQQEQQEIKVQWEQKAKLIDPNLNPMELAQAKADFFLSLNMKGDAIQEIFNLENSSEEWQEQLNLFQHKFCKFPLPTSPTTDSPPS
jgi:hypothetical protein